MSDLAVIILAAGKGTRMKSQTPKVMHEVAGKKMIDHVLLVAQNLDAQKTLVVLSPDQNQIADYLADKNCEIVIQENQLGTADAVKSCKENLKDFAGKILVLYGDVPLVKTDILSQAIKVAPCFVGMQVASENKYGRLFVDDVYLQKIIEFNDASEDEKQITLCNTGVICFESELLFELLAKVNNDNAKGEFYITDIAQIANNQGAKIGIVEAEEENFKGVNSMSELAETEKIKQQELRKKFMEAGVKMISPDDVFLSEDTQIGKDVTIEPFVYIKSGVKIGDGVTIKSFSHLEEVEIKSGSSIGPFARLRPGTVIGENTKIGNFVEIKKSEIGDGVGISHLSYIGDAQVGDGSNIGAGAITCNYDGYKKHKTEIGKSVFIGSNSALVAPVVIHDRALIAAGSVVTEEVYEDELVLTRNKQVNKQKGAEKFRNKSGQD